MSSYRVQVAVAVEAADGTVRSVGTAAAVVSQAVAETIDGAEERVVAVAQAATRAALAQHLTSVSKKGWVSTGRRSR